MEPQATTKMADKNNALRRCTARSRRRNVLRSESKPAAQGEAMGG